MPTLQLLSASLLGRDREGDLLSPSSFSQLIAPTGRLREFYHLRFGRMFGILN